MLRTTQQAQGYLAQQTICTHSHLGSENRRLISHSCFMLFLRPTTNFRNEGLICAFINGMSVNLGSIFSCQWNCAHSNISSLSLNFIIEMRPELRFVINGGMMYTTQCLSENKSVTVKHSSPGKIKIWHTSKKKAMRA